MASTKWTHVYDLDDDGKYIGFFTEAKLAKAWVKDQKGRNLEVTDRRPVTQEAQTVDQALDAALVAVRTKTKEAGDEHVDGTD